MTAITGSNVWTRIITFLGGLDASRDKQHTILETIELSDDPWLEIGLVEKEWSQCTAPCHIHFAPSCLNCNCKESDDEFNYEVTAVHGNLDFDLLVYTVYPFFGKGAFFSCNTGSFQVFSTSFLTLWMTELEREHGQELPEDPELLEQDDEEALVMNDYYVISYYYILRARTHTHRYIPMYIYIMYMISHLIFPSFLVVGKGVLR
jgi:hypothetical protein